MMMFCCCIFSSINFYAFFYDRSVVLFRAEKSEVLNEDLVLLEKRVSKIKTVCQNTIKKLTACLPLSATANPDKNIVRIEGAVTRDQNMMMIVISTVTMILMMITMVMTEMCHCYDYDNHYEFNCDDYDDDYNGDYKNMVQL